MTHRLDVARGRDVVARWCALAEQRLDYLTELFETGRWRRYHSERAFLENIQEAKTAVETWRDLATREASRDNAAVDMSWLGRARATLRAATEDSAAPRPAPISGRRHRRLDRPQAECRRSARKSRRADYGMVSLDEAHLETSALWTRRLPRSVDACFGDDPEIAGNARNAIRCCEIR